MHKDLDLQRSSFYIDLIKLCKFHGATMTIDNEAWEHMELPAFIGPMNIAGFQWVVDVGDIQCGLNE